MNSHSLIRQYLSGYPIELHNKVQRLIDNDSLENYLSKYSQAHQIQSDGALREYVFGIKNQFIKQSSPLNKVAFDGKMHVVKNALGTHTYVSRVQGSKLKSNHELRVSSLFKQAPEAMLNMIVVHELAHLKEKEHNKAFYRLCCHMLPDYHQIEFDTRLYLIAQDVKRLS